MNTYSCSSDHKSWSEPLEQQALTSAMQTYGCPDTFIDSLLTLMQYRHRPRPGPHKRLCYYGEKLRNGEMVKLVSDGFLVPATVIESWLVANVMRVEKSGEVKWVPGEADLYLG